MSMKQNDERQFTKKPVTIQAIQWTGRNLREVIAFTDGPPDTRSAHAGMAWDAYVDLVARDGLKIYTLEGKMSAAVGDWIIKGVQGEHYPCKDDIFEATYSRAALAAPAQQPWQYTPPAQERIDALELEVRQLTEQIAELRGGGAAKEYAELPESCYEDDSGLKTYDSGDMRTFADATHALRIQQPAPSAASVEPLQAFDSPRAKSLMRAWEEGWEACRDAEYVGEEAQNDAFNSSHTLTLCLAEDQLLPTPQADSQPAPVLDMAVMQLAESVGLIGPASRGGDLHAAIQRFHDLICVNATIKAAVMAADAIRGAAAPAQDYPPLPMQFACSGVFPAYSADQMRAYIDADRAARAPADSVLEDAARYQWIRGPGEESTRYSRWLIEYWDGPNGWQPMQRERMDSAIDAARKQGGA